MCQMIYWDQSDPGRDAETMEAETLGDLRSLLPAGVEIVGDPGTDKDENCLCPVDLEETFKRAGIQYEPDPMFGYRLLNFRKEFR